MLGNHVPDLASSVNAARAWLSGVASADGCRLVERFSARSPWRLRGNARTRRSPRGRLAALVREPPRGAGSRMTVGGHQRRPNPWRDRRDRLGSLVVAELPA